MTTNKISLRCWNPIGQKFEFLDIIHQHSIMTSLPIPSRGQWDKMEPFNLEIGLTDVDGKTIYYGDIIEFVYCPNSLNKKVIGQVCTDQWNNAVVSDGKEASPYHIENATKGKIIGNIYQNPELLNN